MTAAQDRDELLARLARALDIDEETLRRYAEAEAAVWDAVRERDAAMNAQAEDAAREWAASVPIPYGLALVYERFHQEVEARGPVRIPKGPVRFPIEAPDR